MTVCLSSATAINVIIDLFCRSFGNHLCTMSLSYSLYTAASVFLLRTEKSNGVNEIAGLQRCVDVLDEVSAVHAGMYRAISRGDVSNLC